MIGGVLELGEWLSAPVSSDARAQRVGLLEAKHRPWPLPQGPWLQGQTWRELLFAHWPLPVTAVRDAVPAELTIDTFDGCAWLGITPFRVTGLRVHGAPPVPLVSNFLETNVRTYVTLGDRPGIWFFSLDASSMLAVRGARASFRLPYFRAVNSAARDRDRVAYRTRRAAGPAATFAVDYGPTDAARHPQPGTLEHFLTERYCLYTTDHGRIWRAEIHHPPWSLQPAQADITENTMAAPHGIELPSEPPLLHYAHRQDVVIWPLHRPT
jgi:uncharacterized protein YqjF (DUF2071 family)